MKTRHGFVSNSSSTSFTFCFKGKGIKPLCNLILTKYREQFKRSYDEYHCNAMDVVEAIECQKPECVSIDKVIMEWKADLEETEKYIEESTQKNDDYFYSLNLERKQELEDKIKRLESIKEGGLTTVLLMGFGDNHGEIQGGNLGYAMDYDGRYIDIDEKDLVVFTEQNR